MSFDEKPPAEQSTISKYMRELGKKAGDKNKQKGSEYFRWVRSHGRQKNKTEPSGSRPSPES